MIIRLIRFSRINTWLPGGLLLQSCWHSRVQAAETAIVAGCGLVFLHVFIDEFDLIGLIQVVTMSSSQV
jgi:hypothetical protein